MGSWKRKMEKEKKGKFEIIAAWVSNAKYITLPYNALLKLEHYHSLV